MKRVIVVLLLLPQMALAETALIGIAANFSEVARQLATAFKAEEGGRHSVKLSIGSTGSLYAQIRHGAPFDALLAADAIRPALLQDEGHAVAGTRFTYAIGQLTLWSANPATISNGAAVLRSDTLRRVAIANPKIAPYGMAALQVMDSLGVTEAVQGKLVRGENIGQAFAMVSTGNAEIGFVALSYVLSEKNRFPGSRWDVPEALHDPIRQDAVLLEHGLGNLAAEKFIRFLASEPARQIIRSYGYGIDSD